MTTSPASDRRQFIRRAIRTPIGIDTDTRKDRVGITRDLSEGGVLFLSASRFDVGETLSMVIRLDGGTDEEISGSVVRVQRRLGIHDLFTHMTAVKFDRPLPRIPSS